MGVSVGGWVWSGGECRRVGVDGVGWGECRRVGVEWGRVWMVWGGVSVGGWVWMV